MVVHSYLYYVLNEQLISDHQWQALADELVEWQKDKYPVIGTYDEAFEDWDASTGYHLPRDPWVESKAHYLLSLHKPTTIRHVVKGQL